MGGCFKRKPMRKKARVRIWSSTSQADSGRMSTRLKKILEHGRTRMPVPPRRPMTTGFTTPELTSVRYREEDAGPAWEMKGGLRACTPWEMATWRIDGQKRKSC